MQRFALNFFSPPVFLSCFLFFSSFPVFSSETKLPQISGLYQFSLENIALSDSERLGLLGTNYLLEKNNGYVGLGVYGAVTGDRGGFFTGGLHIGKSFPLFSGYFLDGNAFVGGGGGGAAPQGGGLMLRAALGAARQLGAHRLFLGMSRVSFPNGNINSNQVSFAYDYRFQSLHFSGWDFEQSKITWNKIFASQRVYPQQVSMQVMNYYPGGSVKGRDLRLHQPVLGVLGIRVSQKMAKRLWGEFETAGAMRGGIDGFAQVLGGVSVKQSLNPILKLSGGWLLGAAGGGNVDTGGGVITRVYAGVEIAFHQRWSTYLQLGYLTALDGAFAANTANINLVYRFENIAFDRKELVLTDNKKLKWRKLRIRPGVQRYTGYAGNARKYQGQENLDVDLVNLKLDAFIGSGVFFTGQALGAFDGKAGGYAVGFLGPGFQFSRYVGAELLVGVAGGGGLAVGNGKIVQPMINFEIPHNRKWSSEISTGYIKAVDGDLSAFVLNLGLVYRFAQPYY